MTLCQFLHEREIGRGRHALRRQTHEPRNLEAALAAAIGKQCGQVLGGCSRFLRLFADIDLHEQLRQSLPGSGLGRQRIGKRTAVQTVQRVKQTESGFELVALQRTDHVQAQSFIFFARACPFALRLVHAIFAKNTMPKRAQSLNARRRLLLAHRNQKRRRVCLAQIFLQRAIARRQASLFLLIAHLLRPIYARLT